PEEHDVAVLGQAAPERPLGLVDRAGGFDGILGGQDGLPVVGSGMTAHRAIDLVRGHGRPHLSVSVKTLRPWLSSSARRTKSPAARLVTPYFLRRYSAAKRSVSSRPEYSFTSATSSSARASPTLSLRWWMIWSSAEMGMVGVLTSRWCGRRVVRVRPRCPGRCRRTRRPGRRRWASVRLGWGSGWSRRTRRRWAGRP